MLKTSFCKDFLMNASLMSQLSLQSPQKAGLYVYVNVIFFESEILGILLYGLGVRETQKSLYKTSTRNVYFSML